MVFKTQLQEDYQATSQTCGERFESRMHSDHLKVEGEFQSRSQKEYASGERALITKKEDNLRMEGDFIKKVPEKWEPGQRDTIVKHKDNLTPPGPVEDNRDKAPTSMKGNKTPVTKPDLLQSNKVII